MPNYRVVFREEGYKIYNVLNCRTSEEAESVATDLWEDGEEPDEEAVETASIEVEEIEEEE